MSAKVRGRRLLWNGAHRLTRALRPRAGIYDVPRVASIFIPALHDGRIETVRLGPPAESARWRTPVPPRSLEPSERFDEAYLDEPQSFPAASLLRPATARLIGAEAVLVDPDSGAVYEDSVAAPQRIDRLTALKRARVLSQRRRLPRGACVLTTYRASNYYHFVTDVLTRLFAFGDEGRADLAAFRRNTAGVTFVLDAAGPRWQKEFVELLGVEHSTVRLDDASNVVADELVFPAYLGRKHPRFGLVLVRSAVADWLRSLLREAAGARFVDERRRLYITRRLAPTRSLANEPEIERSLQTHGFESLAAETLSIRDQIRAFAGAEAVVAPHGAGLTNILFASPATVVELVSPLHIVPCYYTLGQALGHDYWYLVGTVDASQPQDFTATFAVPRGPLEETLAAALAARHAS